MTKIVYNACYGGFGLSKAALDMYNELSGRNVTYGEDVSRTDPFLVRVVEALGDKAGDRFSELRIRELKRGTKYRIDEYDGWESVMTIDDYEWRTA
jgi:hypothetical protein